MLVIGKSVSGGIPLGAYGMTAPLAAELDDPSTSWGEGVATGGTLFGNALSLAAARITLEEVLTDEAYEHAATLGGSLADGIEATAAANGLDWRAHRLFNRTGYTHGPDLPSNVVEARATFDAKLFNAQRLYMVNRGVWEAIDSAGPACGIQTTPSRSTATSRCWTASCVRSLDEVAPVADPQRLGRSAGEVAMSSRTAGSGPSEPQIGSVLSQEEFGTTSFWSGDSAAAPLPPGRVAAFAEHSLRGSGEWQPPRARHRDGLHAQPRQPSRRQRRSAQRCVVGNSRGKELVVRMEDGPSDAGRVAIIDSLQALKRSGLVRFTGEASMWSYQTTTDRG
jgi:hypothetical protein